MILALGVKLDNSKKAAQICSMGRMRPDGRVLDTPGLDYYYRYIEGNASIMLKPLLWSHKCYHPH